MRTVAIIGATGVVGQELLHCLNATNFPTDGDHLHLYASARSAGKVIATPFGDKKIELFSVEAAGKADVVFLAVGGGFAKEHARALSAQGAIVIDNSSAFRYEEDVPLIVPEINADAIGDAKLISNPNCTTAILAMALWPIYQTFGLKRVIVSTYQATSGGGKACMDELREQTQNYLEDKPVTHEHFAHPIPFNLIPQIDVFQDNGYTKEEMKVTWETRKIFGLPDLPISCTAVRIPTFRAHAESVTLETEKEVDLEKVREILASAQGVKLCDDQEKLLYPMPLTSTEQFDVEVGRIRANDVFGDRGLDFFVCGDQLLRGAALNGVLIAHKCL